MKYFLPAILSITLFISCTKVDTPPDSPMIPAKWQYISRALDEDNKGYFGPNDTTSYASQGIYFTFKSDATGKCEGESFTDVPFTWYLGDTQLYFTPTQYLPDFPSTSFHLKSLTNHDMVLTNTVHGHAQQFVLHR
jgi:hypothetical protein